MSIITTRFAPSPTGYLHIGSARTALFNYLFAKHHKGKFLLRIEDTDRTRSSFENQQIILDVLKWLNINWDKDPVYQSQRINRHLEIATHLINKGMAYYCFTSQDELANLRQTAYDKKENFVFRSPWRDKNIKDYHVNDRPVIRLKIQDKGKIIVKDKLQGDVVTDLSQIDDLILVRADGTPTYNLAVAVDDHDMNITHIIRGDDHLTNTPKQQIIYEAMGWQIPEMIHIPLIYNESGAKLSKRDGAPSVSEYEKMGYLPETICNYILRLGWAHGNDEIISREKAIEWFDIKGLGKSPARLDQDKMKFLNKHYIKLTDSKLLTQKIFDYLDKNNFEHFPENYILSAVNILKTKVYSLNELYELVLLYNPEYKLHFDEQSEDFIQKIPINLINEIVDILNNIEDFNKNNIQDCLKIFANNNFIPFNELMGYVRALITGSLAPHSTFALMEIIGKEASCRRLQKMMN